MEAQGFLGSVFVYLLAAVVAVPLFKRLGLGSVLGYLVAGIAIGPSGFGVIQDAAILEFSAFGVVLLMFLIGLELMPARLWQMRHHLIGFGTMQVVGSALLIAAMAGLVGLPGPTALAIGVALALSSTPIALQELEERKLMKSDLGSASFTILLFQDISIIPILAVIPFVTGSMNDSGLDMMAAIKVFGVILFFVLASRFLLRPLFRFMAITGMREIFTSFALFLVVGSGLLVEAVGISMALGAFLAGVLLADSEYRHELELNIEPFKGLLMGLFFVAVGMSVDLSLFFERPLLILLLVLALITTKMIVLVLLAPFAGVRGRPSIFMAFLLAPAGEFAFVLIPLMSGTQLLPDDIAGPLTVVATFSMLITPLLLGLWDWMQKTWVKTEDRQTDVEANEGHVIVAGFGRFGQIIGRFLMSLDVPVTVVDNNPDQIETLRKFGFQVFYGDATRLDLLEAAGAADARMLVLAIDDSDSLLKAAEVAKRNFPKLPILARAVNRNDVMHLMNAGVEHVRRETFGSALELGEAALRELGYPAHQAHKRAARFRRLDEGGIQAAAHLQDDQEALISYSKRARKELERLMQQDALDATTDKKEW